MWTSSVSGCRKCSPRRAQGGRGDKAAQVRRRRALRRRHSRLRRLRRRYNPPGAKAGVHWAGGHREYTSPDAASLRDRTPVPFTRLQPVRWWFRSIQCWKMPLSCGSHTLVIMPFRLLSMLVLAARISSYIFGRTCRTICSYVPCCFLHELEACTAMNSLPGRQRRTFGSSADDLGAAAASPAPVRCFCA